MGLCLKSEANMKVIARTRQDDVRDAELRPEDILPNETAFTITCENMMILCGKNVITIKRVLTYWFRLIRLVNHIKKSAEKVIVSN